MNNIIDGKAIAKNIRLEIAREIKDKGIKAKLSVILVGENPASVTYVNSKEKASAEVGIESLVIRMPDATKQEDLEEQIRKLNNDPKINGILVQLPLPKQINENEVLGLISPKKDVDGLHPINIGKLFLGQEPDFYPCTPAGIMELIYYTKTELAGKNAVVIGRSNIVGKPVAQLLMRKHATITMCHSRTKNIGFFTKEADIVVVAIGKPRFLTANMVRNEALIIDVGMNRTEKGLVGDVDFERVREIASYITPVPGGVGPMTIAMLLKNCLESAKRVTS